MRTYDDSFSGQKIYPGKVRSLNSPLVGVWEENERETAISTTDGDFDIAISPPIHLPTARPASRRFVRTLLHTG
jgi:hypothetical protein